MTSPRILLLRHFEETPAVNGFTARYDMVVRAARTFAMVEEATIGPIGSGATIEVEACVFDTSRLGRIRRLQGALGLGGPFARASKTLEAAVKKKKVSVIFGCTYRSPELYRRVARRAATFVFVEERTRAFGYGASVTPSLRSQIFATAERNALRRLLGNVRGIVVIQSGEIEAAKKRWKKPVWVVPHAIAEEEFIGAATEALAVDCFTVGNFTERRNADGLRQFLEALEQSDESATWSLAAVSATGFAHELKEPSSRNVEFRGGLRDLGPSYASARVVVVPSFAISGSKTTILQGWAAKRPVVATRVAADSVGATHGIDVLVGETAHDLVQQCGHLLASSELTEQIVAGGTKSLGLRHSERAVVAALKAMLHDDWENKE